MDSREEYLAEVSATGTPPRFVEEGDKIYIEGEIKEVIDAGENHDFEMVITVLEDEHSSHYCRTHKFPLYGDENVKLVNKFHQ